MRRQIDPPERRSARNAALELQAASAGLTQLQAAISTLRASSDVDDVTLTNAAKVAVRGAESPAALRVLLIGLTPVLAPGFGGDASRALGALIEARDRGVATHHYGVEAAASRLARHLGYGRNLEMRIVRAARVFDVGKLFLPVEILYDERPLDRDTWPIAQGHVVESWSVVKAIPSLAPLAAIVRAHHERPDGHGYPDALDAGDIPFESRILSVADAWVSVVSMRPYRPAMTVKEAILMLEDGRGMQWDAEIVDALLTFVAPRKLKYGASQASTAVAASGTSIPRRV